MIQRLPYVRALGRDHFRLTPLREGRELVFVLDCVSRVQIGGVLDVGAYQNESPGVDEGGSAVTPAGSVPFQSGPTIA